MYQDAELEFWGEVFVSCDLAATGLRFEQFVANPFGALTNLPNTFGTTAWRRRHSLTATQIVDLIPVRLEGWTDHQRAGVAEHARHDILARHFQSQTA